MSEIRANTVSNAAGTGPVTLTGQYAAKVWANFNGTGTIALRDSANVSSLTDRSVGEFNVNFTNSAPDANYSFQGNRSYRGVVNAEGNTSTYAKTYAAETDSPYLFDPEYVYIAIFW